MEKRKIINIVVIILLTIAAICGFFFLREYRVAHEEMVEYAILQEQFTSVSYSSLNEESSEPFNESEDVVPPAWAGLPYVEVDFESLLQINPNTVGWLAIPNTSISYPVVQTTNHTRYLSTSFGGGRSRAGTLFADKNNDMQNLNTNTIIYGHNMGTGRQDMFSSLLMYKDYEYFQTHRFIQFDTTYERHGWWEVFAVVEYNVRSSTFQFLQIGFSDVDSFIDWAEQIRERSTHYSDVGINHHDRILTLSTCDRSRYGRDGRLLILAVHVNNQ